MVGGLGKLGSKLWCGKIVVVELEWEGSVFGINGNRKVKNAIH